MIKIIKEEIEIEESLESRLRVICDFCNTTTIIENGSIRRIFTKKCVSDCFVKDNSSKCDTGSVETGLVLKKRRK